MSRNYKFHDPEGIYFVSFATVFWVDVFVRRLYFDCLVESLNHCVDEKGMEIYAWCIMPSHVHLVFRSAIEKPVSTPSLLSALSPTHQSDSYEMRATNLAIEFFGKKSAVAHDKFYTSPPKPGPPATKLAMPSRQTIDQYNNY